MSKLFSDALPGGRWTGYVAVKKSSVGKTKTGGLFIDLLVSDGVESIPAKMWDHKEGEPVPKVDTVIQIPNAVMGEYQGRKQLTLDGWCNADPGECDPRQFIPVCPRSMDSMLSDLEFVIGAVAHKGYRKLLKHVLCDQQDQDKPSKLFIEAPGAKGIHHAYIGGLLEHSLGVCDCARFVFLSGYFDIGKINIDLLITGALLHDIGKTLEYDWSGCTIQRTDIGRLVGHVPLSLKIIELSYQNNEDVRRLLSHEDYIQLCHLIASHHGRKEWGATAEPMTREAVILHHADMLDYQMNVIDKAEDEARKSNPERKWTGGVAGLGREFWIGGQGEQRDQGKEGQCYATSEKEEITLESK